MANTFFNVEYFLFFCVFAALGTGIAAKTKQTVKTTYFIVGAGLLIASVSFYERTYSRFVLFMIAFAAFVVFSFCVDWLRHNKFQGCEFGILYLTSTIGLLFAVKADDFLTLLLALELAQTSLVFLIAFKRSDFLADRAAVRFLTVSAISDVLFVFGATVVYAATGTFEYAKLQTALSGAETSPALVAGFVFLFAGFFVKTAAVPFHLWYADVSEGAPPPVSAFIGVVWRLSLMCVLARWVFEPFKQTAFFCRPVLLFFAVCSVVFGATGTVLQTKVKRLAAFTVVTGNGFAFMALAVGDMSALLFLLIVETVLYTGLFAIVLSLKTEDGLSEDILSLKGKGRNVPLRGAFFSMVFVGLSGLPPFAGFWGRFFLLKESVMRGAAVFAIVALTGEVLSAYAYLRMVYLLYKDMPADDFAPIAFPMRFTIVAAAFFSVFLMVWIVPLSAFVQKIGF